MITIRHRRGGGSITQDYENSLVPDITLTWDEDRDRWYIETEDAAQFTAPQDALAEAIANRLKDTIAEIVRAHQTTDALLAAIHVLENQVQRYKEQNEQLLRSIAERKSP